MEIIFATHNQYKANEIKQMVAKIAAVKDLEDVGFTEDIPENGSTLQENALEKAQFVFKRLKKPVFADDTGFEIDALGGKPGVYSARYAGLPKNDKANLDKVLKEMQGETNRQARFRTVICFVDKDNQPIFFEGIVNGEIISIPRGTEGFGYDPVFVPEGYDATFAEMDLAQKNKLSHRGKAFDRLVAHLKLNFG